MRVAYHDTKSPRGGAHRTPACARTGRAQRRRSRLTRGPVRPSAALERTPEKPSPAIVAGLLAFFGVLYGIGSRLALRGFPYSGDEYSYFLQGELFARGLLRAPAPPNANLLWIDHVVIDQFVRSKYPPGTAALLSLGVRAGVPWLVTPLEGLITLVLVWFTARALMGPRAAMVTLLVLGASPLFAVEAATFFSHTATTMWLAASFAAVTAWSLSKRQLWLPVAGAAIGCAFLTRPVDALLFGAALVALRSWRVLVLVAVGATPFVVAHFAYQAAVFGSPFVDGYAAYEPTFRAIYGAETAEPPLSLTRIFNPLQQWFHLDICASFVSPWTMPGAALLAVFGAAAIPKGDRARPMRDVAVAIAVVALVALIPTISSGGDDGPRPRYLTTTLLAVAMLAGAGWPSAREAMQQRIGSRAARTVGAVAVVMGFVLVGALVIDRAMLVQARDGLYEAVHAQGIEQGVVVVRAQWPTRYARNGPFFDRSVLYLSAPADMSVDAIAEKYPSRPLYEATEAAPWKIVRRR
jgi:4-amino-4-deoxy-L-arabinose transferase-like glycosyltransferase